jgi:hypothetical protein
VIEQYATNELNFSYTAEAVVSHLTPASGPTSVPTTLHISGANFDVGRTYGLSVSCLLRQSGNATTLPALLSTNGSTSELNCTVPTSPFGMGAVAGAMDVYVALSNGAHGPGRVFTRYPPPTLRAISPTLGVGASTVVRLIGDGLLAGTDRRCRFGGMEVPAYATPGGTLQCTAPNNAVPGDVRVTLTLNGMQYVDAGGADVRFRFLTAGMVFVSSVEPPLGPLAGGTNVSVYGTNFVALQTGLSCTFDAITVNATFISSDHLLCDAPPVPSATLARVRVSLNLQEYYEGTTFAYAADGSVGRPLPASKGRSGGGSVLVRLSPPLSQTVSGRGSFACRFGTATCGSSGGYGGGATCVVSAATLVSSDSMRCAVPVSPLAYNPLVPSTDVSLWLTLNGAQWSYGPATFTYFEVDPQVHAVEPPIGPIHGATAVFVRGVGLHAGIAGEHGCRFLTPSTTGGAPIADVVPATPAADQTGLRCVSPANNLAVETTVEVTLNNFDWAGNATFASFTYTLSAAPSIITPPSGPRHGGTTLLFALRPRPLAHMDVAAGLVLCRLGNGTVPGTFEASGQLRCISPAGPVQQVSVAAAINGQQFEEGGQSAIFSYVFSLSDLMGETDPSTNPSAAAGPAPPLAPPPNATALLEGLGGDSSTTSGPSPPRALVAYPLVGPTDGGTNVTLTAQFSLAVATALRCRFGPSTLAGSDVPAYLAPHNDRVASCVTPPAALTTYATSAAVYPYTTTVAVGVSLVRDTSQQPSRTRAVPRSAARSSTSPHLTRIPSPPARVAEWAAVSRH